VKYLKGYSKHLSRDIQRITKLDYINFTNERLREIFTHREINQISDLTGMAEMHAGGSEMDCMDLSELSLYVVKFQDEWFVLIVDIFNEGGSIDWVSHYYLCDQFDNVLKFIKEVVDEVY